MEGAINKFWGFTIGPQNLSQQAYIPQRASENFLVLPSAS